MFTGNTSQQLKVILSIRYTWPACMCAHGNAWQLILQELLIKQVLSTAVYVGGCSVIGMVCKLYILLPIIDSCTINACFD